MYNGDVIFFEIMKEECKDIDTYGTKMYRGISFGDTGTLNSRGLEEDLRKCTGIG